ncbi:MAG: ABC transporter permease [Candidatus Methanofastidiosia archaeon]
MKTICIKAILKKDAIAAARNKLVLLGLVWGILIALVYYTLPSTVEETFDLAVYNESSFDLFSQIPELEEEGVQIDYFSSEKEIESVVEEGNYVVGIVLPEDFDSQLRSGKKPTIRLYFKSDQPESLRNIFEHFMEYMVEYVVFGIESELEEEILGEDMGGKHIPIREQSIPLYLLMALVIEMWTLSTLVVEESAAGTLRAVLVTPASPSDIITSKGILGIGYTIFVAIAILILTQSLRGNLPVLFLGVFLGAVMFVGLALFLGSLTKNITTSIIYVAVPMLILLLPGMLILIPDVSLSTVRFIPTYHLVNAFNQILNYGAELSDVWDDFLVIVFLDVVFFILGVFALRRRFS